MYPGVGQHDVLARYGDGSWKRVLKSTTTSIVHLA